MGPITDYEMEANEYMDNDKKLLQIGAKNIS